MFCKYCGAQVPDGAQFCPKCGAELSAEVPQQPEAAKAPEEEPQQKPGFDWKQLKPTLKVTPEFKINKRAVILLVVLVVVLLIAGLCKH